MMANEQFSPAIREYIDVETGLGRVRGNKALYGRMLQLFLSSAEFDALEANLAEGDLAKAGEVAHAIKGMTGNLGLEKLFTLSSGLVTQLREGAADEAALGEYRAVLQKTFDCANVLIEELKR